MSWKLFYGVSMVIAIGAMVVFSDNPETYKITTPVIATGENINVHLVTKPTLVLGLYTQYGPVEISVALEENDKLSEVYEVEDVLTEV